MYVLVTIKVTNGKKEGITMEFGYMRVSSTEQNLDRQLVELKKYVSEEQIYSDKASGKDFEREGFKSLLKALRKGDTLYIKSLDRLGRNKELIKKYLEQLKKKMEASHELCKLVRCFFALSFTIFFRHDLFKTEKFKFLI